MAGPHVLSDLRIGAGPLYVRYGSFAERLRVGRDGRVVSVIDDGEGGLAPDVRAPTFEVPPWVELPRCLEAHLAARGATTVEDMPYRIERALHFSNGGGLYLGEDPRSGDRVVLKEARPHAGLSADGADAVAHRRPAMASYSRPNGGDGSVDSRSSGHAGTERGAGRVAGAAEQHQPPSV